MTPVDLGPYLDAARSHPPVHRGRRRRVVLRWHDADIARLDALRERHKVPRATVARALVYLGLLMVEERTTTATAPAGDGAGARSRDLIWSASSVEVPSLDLNDRAALLAWIVALHEMVTEANERGFDAAQAPEHRKFPSETARGNLSNIISAIDRHFALVRDILRAARVAHLATPEHTARHEAEVRAHWDAEQAKLPPAQRRTWEQACADDEEHMERALRAAAKRDDL